MASKVFFISMFSVVLAGASARGLLGAAQWCLNNGICTKPVECRLSVADPAYGVGKNLCDCTCGFTGPQCENAPPPGQTCSGRGLCVKGLCQCNAGWDGNNCELCAPHNTGANCDQCKLLWTNAPLCDQCGPGFTGAPACTTGVCAGTYYLAPKTNNNKGLTFLTTLTAQISGITSAEACCSKCWNTVGCAYSKYSAAAGCSLGMTIQKGGVQTNLCPTGLLTLTYSPAPGPITSTYATYMPGPCSQAVP